MVKKEINKIPQPTRREIKKLIYREARNQNTLSIIGKNGYSIGACFSWARSTMGTKFWIAISEGKYNIINIKEHDSRIKSFLSS